MTETEDKKRINNSDILFVYDAKLCNPNGDPDDENKPRMDYDTETNLVSDVRLKRYIRDYLMSECKDQEIFVSKVDAKTVNATKRLEKLFEKYEENGKKTKVNLKKLQSNHVNWLLSKLIDVRFFGATMPITSKEGAGVSSNFTGPVQFNWGYSLNKTAINPSSSITSTFAGRTREKEGEEEATEYGTFGKDWRVLYSLIAFHGIISGKRAVHTNLSENDVKLLDDTLIKAIPLEATTRSKIGQTPRLLLRVEYKNDKTFLGDLRRYVKANPKNKLAEEKLRDINEIELDIEPLVNLLEKQKDQVQGVYMWKHDELNLKGDMELKQLKVNNGKSLVQELPHPQEEPKE